MPPTNLTEAIEMGFFGNAECRPANPIKEYKPLPVMKIEAALRSARAFHLAIDALPVGKDIRVRLAVHLGTHIASLEALRHG